MGGAITATTDDGAAVWYNPAGLGANLRDSVDISASAFVLRLRDMPGGLFAETSAGVEARDLADTALLSVPGALAYVRGLSPTLSLGFGLFLPVRDALDL